jgi:5-methylcytosine-specific restriction protein A
MNEEDINLLETLRLKQINRIIDLVDQSGIDVSKWGFTEKGAKVKNPQSNPAYCSEWSFGGDKEPTLLCVWHRSLKVTNGQIFFEDNLRQRALDLVRTAETEDSSIKSKASICAKRARNLISAFQAKEPVRVVILASNSQSKDDEEPPKYRSLDTEQWYVHDYKMEIGFFRLVRSTSQQADSPLLPAESLHDKFVDQFSIPVDTKKQESTISAYVRNPEVRKTVLRRAAGVFEICGLEGFKMDNGEIFLETHHVHPLAENGPDIKWNVVAICPNDHRRAHYSENRDQIKEQLMTILAKHYPD